MQNENFFAKVISNFFRQRTLITQCSNFNKLIYKSIFIFSFQKLQTSTINFIKNQLVIYINVKKLIAAKPNNIKKYRCSEK